MLGPDQFIAKLTSMFEPTVIDDGTPDWADKARNPKWRQTAVTICRDVDDAAHEEVMDTYARRGDPAGGLTDQAGYSALFDIFAGTRTLKAYDKAGFSENERRLADRMCVFYRLAAHEMSVVMLNALGDNPGEYRPAYADPAMVRDGSQDQRLAKRFYDDYGFDRAVRDGKLDYGSWAILPDEAGVTAAMNERLPADLIRDGWNRKSHQITQATLRYAYDVGVAEQAKNNVKPLDIEALKKVGAAAKARGDLPY
ncbi:MULTISPECIES: hypothetical protein [unclassified Sphingobium]|nr:MULTISPECIES: hypothetical protein [unclassified Sphingobium]